MSILILFLYYSGFHYVPSYYCAHSATYDTLDESVTAENKVELLFSPDKLLLASILRPLHQVTEEMLV